MEVELIGGALRFDAVLNRAHSNMNKIKQLTGYYYAVTNYLRTSKGRHDVIDYVQAVAIIAGVTAIVGVIVKILYVQQ